MEKISMSNYNYPYYDRILPDEQIKFVKNKIDSGSWKIETVKKSVTGLKRDHQIIRTKRSGNLIKFAFHGDKLTFCPHRWADLAIASGSCGFGCRACFLMLTFRIMRDPYIPVIYTNDYRNITKKFLNNITWPCKFSNNTISQSPATSIGLGIDCSDSLLYEGITHNAQKLIPLFSDESINKYKKKLILLTKSANVHYLEDLPTNNIVVSFSLNPEKVADAWEGKYSNGERITPSIGSRLQASLKAEEMGYEVRWRIDPIILIENWYKTYEEFFQMTANEGHRPTTITLGTYREKNVQLDTWRKKWGLLEPEFELDQLEKTGTHRHLPENNRIAIYDQVQNLIIRSWERKNQRPLVSLCKETVNVRKNTKLINDKCNCLNFKSIKEIIKNSDINLIE